MGTGGRKEEFYVGQEGKEKRIKGRDERIKRIGFNYWWDRSCTKKKREIKRIYKKWKKGKGTREKFLEERKKRKYLESKRRKKREEGKELKDLKNEAGVWKYINKKRRKREWKENSIKKKWRKYFMNLLEGTEINTEENKEDMENEDRRQRERGEREEQEIGSGMELGEEKIAKAVTKIKMKKAAGTDGIHMEAWRYGGKEIKNGLVEVLRKIWTKGQIPEEWKTSIILLYKREDQEKIGNYRDISLLCSVYKIYAEILRNRLEEELGKKNLVPESQDSRKAGFRKEKSTMDNIFILNHIAQRKRERRERN